MQNCKNYSQDFIFQEDTCTDTLWCDVITFCRIYLYWIFRNSFFQDVPFLKTFYLCKISHLLTWIWKCCFEGDSAHFIIMPVTKTQQSQCVWLYLFFLPKPIGLSSLRHFYHIKLLSKSLLFFHNPFFPPFTNIILDM